jgi:hypothetical protein
VKIEIEESRLIKEEEGQAKDLAISYSLVKAELAEGSPKAEEN